MPTLKCQLEDKIAIHPDSGHIFTKEINDNVIKYRVFGKNTWDKFKLKEDIDNFISGNFHLVQSIFFKLLVRHGEPGNWNYFPLNQLFISDREREMIAQERGTPNVPSNWARRKARLIFENL